MEVDTPILPQLQLSNGKTTPDLETTARKSLSSSMDGYVPAKASSRVPFQLPNLTSPARYQHVKFTHKAAPRFEALVPESRFSVFQSAQYVKKFGGNIRSGQDYFNSRYQSVPVTEHAPRKTYLDDIRPENGDYSSQVQGQFKKLNFTQGSRINKTDRWKRQTQ